MDKVVNVRIAGLGGMGVLKATLILGELLFDLDYDVKKAEVHGMAQRGGSVSSDVRFGKKVISPMIPHKQIDFLLSLEPEWSDVHIADVKEGGVVISPSSFDASKLKNPKSLNVAALGVLSKYFDFPVSKWEEVLKKNFPEKLWEGNDHAFKLGRGEV